MAPIEPDLTNSNLRPLLLLTGFASSVAGLTAFVIFRVLYRSYRALPPSSAIRSRQNTRQKHIQAYQGLLFLSFSVALYYGFHILGLSYQVWAAERGEPIPTSLWHAGGLFTSDNPVPLKLGRWLRDTDLVEEFWVSTVESSRRQWWTQQLLLGGGAWSTFVAIEGRRRNIPHTWAFVVLAMAISLSFAQNLFFITLLLTPVPLSNYERHEDLVPAPSSPRGKHSRKPSKALQNAAAATESTATLIPHRVQELFDYYVPPKPANWTPHPFLLAAPILCSSAGTVLAALASNTSLSHMFFRDLAIDFLLPHVLLRVAPESWGSIDRKASESNLAAFKIAGLISTIIYAVGSVIAILDNAPPLSRRYWVLPQHQSRAERLKHPGDAMSRVLGTLYDQPAVARLAWDVLLSGASIGVWAGIRGTDAGKMLRATGWATRSGLDATEEAKEWVKNEAKQLVNHVSDEEEEPESPTTGKARGKKGKKADDAVIVAKSSGIQAWTGDEERNEDWEASALGWGLTILGGLGVGSAAVLGSEVI